LKSNFNFEFSLGDAGLNYIFAPPKKVRGVAQSGSVPGLGPGGRRFESCRPDNTVKPSYR